MREKWNRQMPLMPEIASHVQAKELEAVSGIIDGKPIICRFVLQDLCKGCSGASRLPRLDSTSRLTSATLTMRVARRYLPQARASASLLVREFIPASATKSARLRFHPLRSERTFSMVSTSEVLPSKTQQLTGNPSVVTARATMT